MSYLDDFDVGDRVIVTGLVDGVPRGMSGTICFTYPAVVVDFDNHVRAWVSPVSISLVTLLDEVAGTS